MEQKKPKVFAIANYKGGATKTTSAVNLAAVLAEFVQVLVINLDTQQHVELLSGLLGNEELNEKNALNLCLTTGYAMPSTQIISSEYGYDVIGAGPEMVSAEKIIQNSPMGEQRLALLLDADKDALSKYDVILIDTIGSRSVLVNVGLIAADEVIIPVRPGLLDSTEVLKFVEFLDALTLARMGKGPIGYRGIFLSSVQMAGGNQTLGGKVARADLCQSFSDRGDIQICETFIPLTTKVSSASYLYYPIVKGLPDDSASRAYRSLAAELFPEYVIVGKERSHG